MPLSPFRDPSDAKLRAAILESIAGRDHGGTRMVPIVLIEDDLREAGLNPRLLDDALQIMAREGLIGFRNQDTAVVLSTGHSNDPSHQSR